MCWRSQVVALTTLMILAACRAAGQAGGGSRRRTGRFAIHPRLAAGTRDADRLDVQAVYSHGSGHLTVDLNFRVTPPTRLESGTWSGLGGEGAVRERSSTFLGGQSGPPSIGGRFDLLAPDGKPLYRVTIPAAVGRPPQNATRRRAYPEDYV
jgi:hypothetical protein